MQKQQPEAQRQRQHHADGDIAAAEPLAHESHADAGGDREADQPPDRRQADQDRAGRAGKADMAERMTGKSLPAQHQEIAHQSRHDGRHAGGGERIAHEIVFKHGGDRDGGDDRDVVVTMVVQMVGAFDVAPARQHEDMAVGAHHADSRAVELRQHRRRHHLGDGAERGMAIAEIEHAIERADQLIELVGAEKAP